MNIHHFCGYFEGIIKMQRKLFTLSSQCENKTRQRIQVKRAENNLSYDLRVYQSLIRNTREE